jgi:hypothetical protein
MDGFQVELLQRLPLTQAVLRLFSYTLDEVSLGELFEAYRGRCYEDVLSFSTLTYLVRDALVLHRGSGHQTFMKEQIAERLPVAMQNVYGKLARVPLALSVALLRTGAQRLLPLIPAHRPAVVLPDSLSGLRVIVFDGKKIKNAAKRLKALRGLPGKILGGKLLVALDMVSGLAIAVEADPDGERNDVPLVPGLVRQVHEQVAEAILWVADRQFGGVRVPRLLIERPGDHFLIRCTASVKLEADPQRPLRRGVDAAGRGYTEEWGWVGCGRYGRLYVRRITLEREGEDAIILITDLLDERRWPAAELLGVYLQRWGIERVFQKITEVFHLETLIGCSPQATIFQAILCLLLYDLIQVLQAYVALDGRRCREEVSTEMLFRDVEKQMIAWQELGVPEVAVTRLTVPAAMRSSDSVEAMRRWLRETMAGCWRDEWIKSPPKRRRSLPKEELRAKVPHGHPGHSSAWKHIQAAKCQPKGCRRS